MKKLFLAFCLLLTASAAYADIENAPFIPEIDKRFDAIEQGNHYYSNTYPAASVDSHYAKQYVKASYNFSVVGGATGNISLKQQLPANALITRSYIYSIIKPTTSASGTLGFYCSNSSSPEILSSTAAASFASAGAAIDGNQSGAASAMTNESTACTISAKIATGALTAGNVVLYVEYVVHQ